MVGQDALGACRLVWNAVLESIASTRKRWVDEAQLRQMDDRELADLGLCRSGIEFAVRTSLSHEGDRAGNPSGRRRTSTQMPIIGVAFRGTERL
jgi:uncharacterized protein YjiS (DUF1127 family)